MSARTEKRERGSCCESPLVRPAARPSAARFHANLALSAHFVEPAPPPERGVSPHPSSRGKCAPRGAPIDAGRHLFARDSCGMRRCFVGLLRSFQLSTAIDLRDVSPLSRARSELIQPSRC